jgi:hypothetical protein
VSLRSLCARISHAFPLEWIEQNVYPYVLKMDALWNASFALKKASHWPRRPLPVLADLERRLDDKNTNFNYN